MNNLKDTLTAVGTALVAGTVAIAIVACSPEPAPIPTTATVAELSTTPNISDIGLGVLREQYPIDLAGVSDEAIIELAEITCDSLDAGLTVSEYVQTATANGVTPEVAGGLLGFAVVAYCPQHENILGG